MIRSRAVHWALALVCGAVVLRPAFAEDTKGKWQFGFGLSYYATTDYIRSNADIAISSGVVGETTGLPPVTSVDDRPDSNVLNQPSVRDGFKFDMNASYGLTRWLAIELAAGYLKSNVGNIEFYSVNNTFAYQPLGAGPALCGPNRNAPCFGYGGSAFADKSNTFLPVGTITEIPLQASALVRFRPESPLDPYIGLGAGYIFTDLAIGNEFSARSAEVTALTVAVASEGEFTDTGRVDKSVPGGFHPAPLQAEVNNGFEYHMVGGVDYYVNDRFSIYVDARYVWSNTAVNITTDGAHQVLLSSSDLGKLRIMTNGSVTQPNYWEDSGLPGCPQCAGDGLLATEDSNGNGTLDADLGEGGGILYLFPAGPNPANPNGSWNDPSEAVMVIDCTNQPTCAWRNGTTNAYAVDSEDRNYNKILDRFLYYGVDICSGGGTDPICGPNDATPSTQYVWPGGCPTFPPSNEAISSTHLLQEPEGCPGPPSQTLTPSSADDVNDIYIIQGGRIKLGGFSLGLGVKFTF